MNSQLCSIYIDRLTKCSRENENDSPALNFNANLIHEEFKNGLLKQIIADLSGEKENNHSDVNLAANEYTVSVQEDLQVAVSTTKMDDMTVETFTDYRSNNLLIVTYRVNEGHLNPLSWVLVCSLQPTNVNLNMVMQSPSEVNHHNVKRKSVRGLATHG